VRTPSPSAHANPEPAAAGGSGHRGVTAAAGGPCRRPRSLGCCHGRWGCGSCLFAAAAAAYLSSRVFPSSSSTSISTPTSALVL
jgi:hypothetical protein